MKNNMQHWHGSLLLITLLILAACSDNSSQSTASPTEPVQPIEKTTAAEPQAVAVSSEPSADGIDSPLVFSLTDLDGNTVKAEDYRGQWLVINYWATWCAPCRDEMPELVKFQTENADQVQVVGIAYEDAEVQKLKNFAQDFNINYPLLTIDVYNPPGFAEEGGLGLPTTIVYNPEGMRHKKHMGPIDAEGLLEMVQ
ncbi:Thioredoxin [hydrothermal vent metagenome]|uniref:Thioredoxin n=1 Tax=hydrothermal vent metagenome TaxID=652676 RepID=A0A3B0WSW0_9ZZZZ